MTRERLPDNWRWTTLGEVAAPGRAIVSGPFGSNIGSRFFVDEGVPVIRGNNLTTDMRRFIDEGFVFVTERKAAELRNCDAVVDDLVFTAAGSLGQVALIPKEAEYSRYIISNKQLRVRIDKIIVDPLFAFYWFASKQMVEYIQQRNTGSSVPLINLSVLRSLPLPLPPISEQRAIAHILGTLDDKIELNRRMNETLEAMARALFKSWFVDFDPVRAKAGGRDPGLPKHISSLFPDSFEDSKLGGIPKGWEIKSIGDLADVVGGTTPSTKEPSYWEGGIHAWATPKDLSALSVPVLLNTERRITDEGLSKIGSGLLPKGTVLLSSRAPIGYLAIAEVPVAINQGFIAMTPIHGTSNLFLLLWASIAHEEIVSRANGSTFLEISKTNFRPIPVVTPNAGVMKAFEQLARPLYERIVQCVRESCVLVASRDTLLPKLISGELRT
jgi:type I restriction enzyme S subunit